MGAAFLCADLGLKLEGQQDQAAYIRIWLEGLRYDKQAICAAAAHAQRAADYLNGLQASHVGEAPARKSLTPSSSRGAPISGAPSGQQAVRTKGPSNASQVVQDLWILVPVLFAPAYIGGRTAAENWDLTEPKPQPDTCGHSRGSDFLSSRVDRTTKLRISDIEQLCAHFFP